MLRRLLHVLLIPILGWLLCARSAAAQTLVIDDVQCAGISGFRAHWNQPIPVAENGQRVVLDAKVTDRGQAAVWDGLNQGPLAFDAVHRHLLVRFPTAGQQIAAALAQGQVVAKLELVLPYLDEEIWPQGRTDFPSADGYVYRKNWDVDKLYRSRRPNWHAIAYALRKPWQADREIGPTYNAAINGAVYWKQFGAGDLQEDRFAQRFGPTEVSSYQPEGRMDLTALLQDEAFGATPAERLRVIADQGVILSKWETYDARFYQGAYDWAGPSGARAIIIKRPALVVTLQPGTSPAVGTLTPVDVPALAARHKAQPVGQPTAVAPSLEQVQQLDRQFLTKPAWMHDHQYEHVKQLMTLESGKLEPFYYRAVPGHVIGRAKQEAQQAYKKVAGNTALLTDAELDYAVYLAWLDLIHGQPPRTWIGHLTAQQPVTWWYMYRDALPGPSQEAIRRSWEAWLMPDRETAPTDKQRQDYTDTSGMLVHPMADDPRVGRDPTGKQAQWKEIDTYYKTTGDWRGNKSFFRSGFTRMMSTANFNSTATSGALLGGQIIGSERAMADGRAGLMKFPFWMWTYNAGVGQEYVDHYYWAIATFGNKLFPDFCTQPQDQMAGWSIMTKTIEDLAGAYHPNLKKLLGPASRTYYEHVLGVQDGLYHILHVLSPAGALNDLDTGELPLLTRSDADKNGRKPKPVSAWGHDYPPSEVALQSLSGPWADPWIAELIDDKPLPWSSLVEKKVVAEGDWVTTYFGVNYGLASIRRTPQRVHVLGHWRRQPQRPGSMSDIGTLDLRLGYNQTRFAGHGGGGIDQTAAYRTYQHQNKLIMLARPDSGYFAKLKPGDIDSIQCSAGLFSYEQPEPKWKIYVDDQPVTALPATARQNQVITIQDGVTYLALRPLPSADLGRAAQVTLTRNDPQYPGGHDQVNIQPALVINVHLHHRVSEVLAEEVPPLSDEALRKVSAGLTGFAVEMGDASEYADFAAFRKHARAAKLSVAGAQQVENYTVTYVSGQDTLTAGWTDFTVNGQDPYPAREQGLWRDTPLTQMGLGRLEKGGAVIERETAKVPMLLQTFPKQGIYVAMNPVPGYLSYRFTTPDGVRIVADGRCSMGRWAVKGKGELDLRYVAFENQHSPEMAERATCLFVTGMDGQPKVKLNGQDVSATVKAWQQAGVNGWLVPLGGALRPDAELSSRLASALE